MTDLARLQRQFAAALRGDDGAIALRVRAAGIDPARRIDAYRRNVEAAAHDALAATYPVVRRLVGEAFFGEMVLRYGRRWPSRSGDLHLFGDSLGAFIASYRAAADVPYLADVARLEWACHEALHAAQVPRLDARRLASVPHASHPTIRLRLHPSVRLVASPHPIVALWEANQPDRDGAPDRSTGTDRAIVWRDGAAVRIERLEAPEWECARALARGAALEDAVAAMGDDEAARWLEPLLIRLASGGALADFADEGDA